VVISIQPKNHLYYGDNLNVLRQYIADESIDLCYIDPPFNSKRNYNQIYNNMGNEDRAQAQAFIDTWTWDDRANLGFIEISANDNARFGSKTVDLIKGLDIILGKGSLFAYLISMTLRITEIHRVLKKSGSFYLHCDSTASHYLKLILDTVFVANGGHFINEIAWCYGSGGASKKHFSRKHDTIFLYTKSKDYTFNVDEIREPYSSPHKSMTPKIIGDKQYIKMNPKGRIPFDWWQIPILTNSAKERLGYPTQKPESLLERIITASSNEGDIVLDAFCGCGTTVAVAERLKRRWIGIDITYQSISLILRRLEGKYGKEMLSTIVMNGIPQDMGSAKSLAQKTDDRLRKEFEKWAVLTYSNNRAIINDKKGADKGIDGIAYFLTSQQASAKIVFQVKSGNVGRADIATLNNDRQREGAELAIFITLQPPTPAMRDEANAIGMYEHYLMSRHYPRIQIVTIADIVEQHKRLDIPMSLEVLRKAENENTDIQTTLLDD
jgi:DNA modification methylase